jgi:hypothetical protein
VHDVLAAYAARLHDVLAAYAARLLSNHTRYLTLYTNEEMDDTLCWEEEPVDPRLTDAVSPLSQGEGAREGYPPVSPSMTRVRKFRQLFDSVATDLSASMQLFDSTADETQEDAVLHSTDVTDDLG